MPGSLHTQLHTPGGNQDLLSKSGAWLELPVDLNGNGDPDNTPYHPPSLNQALDFLKPKVNTVVGNPILISLETKGAGWSQAMLNGCLR